MSTYIPSLALQGTIERIKNPPKVLNTKNELVQRDYEHHVGTWACTKLKEIFSDNSWAITPEQKDPNTNKKPDLVVEKAIPGPIVTLKLHLAMELKKKNQRMEDALVQLSDSLKETIENMGHDHPYQYEIFAVVQSGLDIGFFEYHLDESNLDEEGIPHFRGCVSLTYDYYVKGRQQVPIQNKPNDLKNLFFDFDKLKKNTDIRSDAKNYPIPCIFNLENHSQEINAIFQYMEKNMPRSSW